MNVRLVALTDLDRFADPVTALGRLCRLARPGSVALVLRDRDAPVRERLALGHALRQLSSELGQLLFVSDRVDLALELGADGVHLPHAGLLPSQVQRLLPGGIVSRAHHEAEALPEGELSRCSFLLVSPAFAARKGRAPLLGPGLKARFALLRARAPNTRLLALGGIDASSLGPALAAGADGVAAIAALHSPDEQQALVALLGIERAVS